MYCKKWPGFLIFNVRHRTAMYYCLKCVFINNENVFCTILPQTWFLSTLNCRRFATVRCWIVSSKHTKGANFWISLSHCRPTTTIGMAVLPKRISFEEAPPTPLILLFPHWNDSPLESIFRGTRSQFHSNLKNATLLFFRRVKVNWEISVPLNNPFSTPF